MICYHCGDDIEDDNYTECAEKVRLLERKLSAAMDTIKAIEEHEHCQGDPNKPTEMWLRGYTAGVMDGHRCAAAIARETRAKVEGMK